MAEGSATSHDQFGAQIDMRQVFLTIGNASWGQIEVGRDLGLCSTATTS